MGTAALAGFGAQPLRPGSTPLTEPQQSKGRSLGPGADTCSEHVFRKESEGRCNSKRSYPSFFDFHDDRQTVSDLPLATPQMPIFPGFSGPYLLLPFSGEASYIFTPVIGHMTPLRQCDMAFAVLISLTWAPDPCHLILGKTLHGAW